MFCNFFQAIEEADAFCKQYEAKIKELGIDLFKLIDLGTKKKGSDTKFVTFTVGNLQDAIAGLPAPVSNEPKIDELVCDLLKFINLKQWGKH